MDTISVERIWEDVGFFEIEVKAQSELICASVKSYTTSASINELANRLKTFPKGLDDRFIWENGTKGDDSTPCLSLEFWCEDKLGHIVIEVYLEIDDGASYNRHNCCFYLKTEPGLLNRFGKSLVLLNKQGIGRKVILGLPDQ